MAGFSMVSLSHKVNKPVVTVSAVAVAIVLGVLHVPGLARLRPVGDLYIGLLQMCVLPFLLCTIPLAVRSAMTSGTAGHVTRQLLLLALFAIVLVAAVSVVLPQALFHAVSFDEQLVARMGRFVGASADRVDLKLALDPQRRVVAAMAQEGGLLAIVPTNIFAALSSNDSMRVLVFSAIFGISMVTAERQTGHSVFGALRHIQGVCMRIFDWFNVLVPLGIVALIAPQVDVMGGEILGIVGTFCYAFIGVCVLVLMVAVLGMSVALGKPPMRVLSSLLKPMMLGAATRTALVCIPLALEVMRDELQAEEDSCELFIPVGFATLRFGTIIYFVIATLFMGALMGRSFSGVDLLMVTVFATAASFATLGVNGVAALAPLATVLRPFGLSYELAVPLMIIIDPIANMIRVPLNVAINCAIPAIVGGPVFTPAPQPAE